jgi:hypothetical protein
VNQVRASLNASARASASRTTARLSTSSSQAFIRGTASASCANSLQREAARAIAMFICRRRTGSATRSAPSRSNQSATLFAKHAESGTPEGT